jgi:adenosylcobyric acid synthase
VFKQDGYRVAPFKSQNMSSNYFITADGLEMSTAQVAQAEAAGVEPSVLMNPILLKPVTDMGAEVIVNGQSRGHMRAAEYFEYKKSLIPVIMGAFETLAAENDIIVIEGAGSPAEINLRENDIVNMGLAVMVDAPVLLVGDIDCGGVFAQLVGTLVLLEPEERDRVKGLIINKFRGDVEILRSGLAMLEERSGKPVTGVLPYLAVDIDEEDSLVRGSTPKPAPTGEMDRTAYREAQYNILAAAIREHLDLPFMYRILEDK